MARKISELTYSQNEIKNSHHLTGKRFISPGLSDLSDLHLEGKIPMSCYQQRPKIELRQNGDRSKASYRSTPLSLPRSTILDILTALRMQHHPKTDIRSG